MAAVDFPNSPSSGQTFVAPNGVTYQWNVSYSAWVTVPADLSIYAPKADPVFTGNPTAPTPAAADNDTSIATTAWVQSEIATDIAALNVSQYAPLASPTLTGDPKAPTPATGDNDTSIATTAFVKAQAYVTGGPYLPTAGGTLTGALTGTTATFDSATIKGGTTTDIGIGAFSNAAFNVVSVNGDLAAPQGLIGGGDSNLYVYTSSGGGFKFRNTGDIAQIETTAGRFAQTTAPPTGGTLGTGLMLSNVANFGIMYGTGAPDKAAPAGTFYLRRDGAPQYNTDGTASGWTGVGGGGGASISVGPTPPASPTDNSLWWNSDAVAGGGQLYLRYNDGNTAQWIPAAAPGSSPIPSTAPGDFTAIGSSIAPGTGSFITGFTTILAGNSGGWFNTSTGRYTPPAGRYLISAGLTGANNATAVICSMDLYKNGVFVHRSGATTLAAGNPQTMTLSLEVEANGTDYFQLYAGANGTGLNQGQYGYFSATPVGIVVAIPKEQGFRLLQRQVLAADAPNIEYTNIPPDINDIEVRFDLTPVTNAVDIGLQFYDGAGTLLNSGYGWTLALAQNNAGQGGAPVINNNTGAGATSNWIGMSYTTSTSRVSATSGIRGHIKINNIRDATRNKAADWQANYINDTNSSLYSETGSGWRSVVNALSGVRLVFSSGNVKTGSVMSVWGSP